MSDMMKSLLNTTLSLYGNFSRKSACSAMVASLQRDRSNGMFKCRSSLSNKPCDILGRHRGHVWLLGPGVSCHCAMHCAWKLWVQLRYTNGPNSADAGIWQTGQLGGSRWCRTRISAISSSELETSPPGCTDAGAAAASSGAGSVDETQVIGRPTLDVAPCKGVSLLRECVSGHRKDSISKSDALADSMISR